MTVTTCDELQAFHPMVLTLGSLVSLCKKSVHKYRTGYWTERYVYSSGRSNCHTRSSQDPRFSESGAKRATFSCPPGTPLLLPSVQNHPNHKLSTTQTMDTLAAERVTVLCGQEGKGHLSRTLGSLSLGPRIGFERIYYIYINIELSLLTVRCFHSVQ